MRTLKLFGGDFGGEEMLVRCDLVQATSTIEHYCDEAGDWLPTRYQCADAAHQVGQLAEIGRILAAQAFEVDIDNFDCEWEEICE